MSSAALRRPSVRAFVVGALCLALGFLVFGAGLDGPFVFDDFDAIVANESLASWATAFRPPVDTSFAGRPLVNASVALDRALFGLEPAALHRTNLVLHVACVLLAMALVRAVVRGPRVDRPELAGPVALGAGLLALVHPLNSEVVYYASPRTELVLALFFFGTFLCVARRVTGGGTAWLVGAIALAWLGALSKEVMAVTPPLAFLFVAAYFADGFGDAWRRHKRLFLGLASAWVPIALSVASSPRALSVGLGIAGGPIDYLKMQCLVLPAYALRVVWPADLIFDYGMLVPVTWGAALPGFGALGVAFVGACWLMWKRPALGFPALFVFVVLAPSSSFVPIVTEIGADRRMYLPLFAILATALFGLARWLGPRTALAAAALAAIPLGVVSHARGDDFATPLALWESTVRVRPENPRAWFNVADQHARAGRFEEALPAVREAARIFPGQGEFRLSHGAALANLGRFDEALVELEAADSLLTTNAAKDAQLRVLAAQGRIGEARRRLRGWTLDEGLARTAVELGIQP
ncbi:MAG: tetratricopeptide repeat protein [Planctomycetota bacterium]